MGQRILDGDAQWEPTRPATLVGGERTGRAAGSPAWPARRSGRGGARRRPGHRQDPAADRTGRRRQTARRVAGGRAGGRVRAAGAVRVSSPTRWTTTSPASRPARSLPVGDLDLPRDPADLPGPRRHRGRTPTPAPGWPGGTVPAAPGGPGPGRGIAASSGLVLALDDLHWADEAPRTPRPPAAAPTARPGPAGAGVPAPAGVAAAAGRGGRGGAARPRRPDRHRAADRRRGRRPAARRPRRGPAERLHRAAGGNPFLPGSPGRSRSGGRWISALAGEFAALDPPTGACCTPPPSPATNSIRAWSARSPKCPRTTSSSPWRSWAGGTSSGPEPPWAGSGSAIRCCAARRTNTRARGGASVRMPGPPRSWAPEKPRWTYAHRTSKPPRQRETWPPLPCFARRPWRRCPPPGRGGALARRGPAPVTGGPRRRRGPPGPAPPAGPCAGRHRQAGREPRHSGRDRPPLAAGTDERVTAVGFLAVLQNLIGNHAEARALLAQGCPPCRTSKGPPQAPSASSSPSPA